MARRYGPESLEHEVAELRKHQKQLLSALRLLFDLLEAYAPSWYTEEHHKKALAALWVQPCVLGIFVILPGVRGGLALSPLSCAADHSVGQYCAARPARRNLHGAATVQVRGRRRECRDAEEVSATSLFLGKNEFWDSPSG